MEDASISEEVLGEALARVESRFSQFRRRRRAPSPPALRP